MIGCKIYARFWNVFISNFVCNSRVNDIIFLFAFGLCVDIRGDFFRS